MSAAEVVRPGPGHGRSLKDVLEGAAGYLKSRGVESPRIAAELLAARLLNCKRLDLMIRLGESMSEDRLDAMRRGTRRVGAGEPVQYVIGETEFMGHRLKVDRRALIPRFETEQLVEVVLSCRDLWEMEKPLILDIGTGSGCIALSIAEARPKAVVIGIDTSMDALELARENALLMKLDERVVFTGADPSEFLDAEAADAVVANLPYVSTSEYERLPAHIRDHEPRPALDGGPDGLSVIQPVIEDMAIALRTGGRIFLEIAASQGHGVEAILKENGFKDISVRKDLSGRDRIVCATRAD